MLPHDISLKLERMVKYTDNPCLALVENYVSVGSDIDENNKTYHFIKVGKGKDALERCDNQRLKLIWGVKPKRNAEKFCYPREGYENLFMGIGHNLFGLSKPDYNMAGKTECYGRFKTAEDAMEGCWKIFEEFATQTYRQERKFNIDITGDFMAFPVWQEKINSIIESVTKKPILVAQNG